jgi:hypothetical protein
MPDLEVFRLAIYRLIRNPVRIKKISFTEDFRLAFAKPISAIISMNFHTTHSDDATIMPLEHHDGPAS